MHVRIAIGVALAASFVGLGGCGGMGRGASGGIADTASAAATPAVSFAQADLNGDARIDRTEFARWLRQSADAASAQAAAGGTSAGDAFYAADTDLSGMLTLDEWQAMMASRSGAARR